MTTKRSPESIRFAPTRQRANKNHSLIQESLEQRVLLQESEQEGLLLEQDARNSISIANNRTLKDKTRLESYAKRDKIINIEAEILKEIFGELCFNSIPLDEDYLDLHRDIIMETAKDTFQNLMNEGVLLEGNMTWNNYIDPVVDKFDDIEDCVNNTDCGKDADEKISNCIHTFPDVKKEDAFWELKELIESKILTTVKNEKDITSMKESILLEHRKANIDTLFHSMNLVELKNLKEETISKNEELDMNVLVETALAETIVKYTIYETLNTCSLLEFSYEGVLNETKKNMQLASE